MMPSPSVLKSQNRSSSSGPIDKVLDNKTFKLHKTFPIHRTAPDKT